MNAKATFRVGLSSTGDAIDREFVLRPPQKGLRRWLRRMQETTPYPIIVRARSGKIVAESRARRGRTWSAVDRRNGTSVHIGGHALRDRFGPV